MKDKKHDDPALEALLKEASSAFAPAEGLKKSLRLRILPVGDQPVPEESPTTPQPAIRPVREVSYGLS